jgi:hypothetical protein
MSATIDNWLVDEAMEAYLDWLQQSVAVQDAYDRWVRAPRDDAAAAFLQYIAALDREECSSLAYAWLVEGSRA